jgi:hypothetical protein
MNSAKLSARVNEAVVRGNGDVHYTEGGPEYQMSKTDAHSPRGARPESELEPMAPAGSGGFAPVPARRVAPLQPEVTAAPLITGGETTQYQVPLDLLVLARNKEKDKARSVAVTPVAPRPNSDEPPPSSELSGLRAGQPAEAAPTAAPVSAPVLTAPPPMRLSPAPLSAGEEHSGSLPAAEAASSTKATVILVVLAALCLAAGYYAVELLRWF